MMIIASINWTWMWMVMWIWMWMVLAAIMIIIVLNEKQKQKLKIGTEALINNNQVVHTIAHESESESPQNVHSILSNLLSQESQMSPTDVQITFIASMMCMAGMTKVVQKIGIKIGRLQTTIICKWIGALLLLSMIQAYKSGQSAMTICTLCVLRTSFMNSCASLTKSVLMCTNNSNL